MTWSCPTKKKRRALWTWKSFDGLEAQDDGTTDGILDLINAFGYDFGDGSEKEVATVDALSVVDHYDDFPQDDGKVTPGHPTFWTQSDYSMNMGYLRDGYPERRYLVTTVTASSEGFGWRALGSQATKPMEFLPRCKDAAH